ncbi:ImmA/IrrE family metallo-endopeptidase [uncultured Roseobacter sp.]|uniref:ImmA/IrrE family metallo-endopeptidase n=1 Tax=uncultured Roseobacter sp. TaxID=114847 RepID=UPI0026243994|nr:ImmA/IrrE family metallo-endopeptidase [uncultured Roseobacter sp.]
MRSIRDLFKKLPSDGDLRHKLRNFNMLPSRSKKAASVRDLALSVGLDVRKVPLPRGMAGRLVQDPFSESGFGIEVNESHDVRSMRFTVLHEMGHYLLHMDRRDPLADPMHLNRSDEEFYFDLKAEREANDFADVLLFGDGSLQAAFSLYNGRLPDIAHYFGVTEKMVEVAMKKFRVK